jgi:hypothetical protein
LKFPLFFIAVDGDQMTSHFQTLTLELTILLGIIEKLFVCSFRECLIFYFFLTDEFSCLCVAVLSTPLNSVCGECPSPIIWKRQRAIGLDFRICTGSNSTDFINSVFISSICV